MEKSSFHKAVIITYGIFGFILFIITIVADMSTGVHCKSNLLRDGLTFTQAISLGIVSISVVYAICNMNSNRSCYDESEKVSDDILQKYMSIGLFLSFIISGLFLSMILTLSVSCKGKKSTSTKEQKASGRKLFFWLIAGFVTSVIGLITSVVGLWYHNFYVPGALDLIKRGKKTAPSRVKLNEFDRKRDPIDLMLK